MSVPRPAARTPKDFAIEFGEYLAVAAEFYLEASTMFRSDSDLQNDAYRNLKSAIYEFRKRARRS